MTWNKSKKYVLLLSYLLVFVVSFCFSARFVDVSVTFFSHFLVESGYGLKKISVAGSEFITQSEVLKKTEKFLGKNTLTLPIFSIRKEIKKMPWCKDVVVTKHLPDQLEIVIEEYKPFAILNSQYLITEEFHNILPFDDKNHINLGLITLDTFDVQLAQNFLKVLKANLDKKIFSKIKMLKHVSGRRWDVVLQCGTIIKLPEENQTQALIRLNKFYSSRSSIDDVKIIDLRIPDKIFFAMADGRQ